jgi:hypothetical protein
MLGYFQGKGKVCTHLTKFLRFEISKGPRSVNKSDYGETMVISIFHHAQGLPIAVYVNALSINLVLTRKTCKRCRAPDDNFSILCNLQEQLMIFLSWPEFSKIVQN